MLSIKVPPLGESITEATVSRWLKNEGDAVAAGETLVELETDKITVEVPALKGGVLTKRAKAEGDVVAVNDNLGEMDETATAAPRAAAASQPAAAVAPSPSTSSAPAAPPAPSAPAAMPAARRLGAEAGIDLSTVQGTGRGGVVSKPDVIAAMSAPAAATPPAVQPPAAVPAAVRRPPSAVSRETREKMSTRRKRIAENLLQAQHNTAHLTTFNEIDMSAIVALRDRMKEKVEKEHGVKLSFMPFFAKAAIMALKAFPVVNAQIDGDSLVYKNYVNLGIAVASEAGLVVPNVKDADSLGILGLSL